MKKAVIVPDSFKGTLTSSEVCDIIERALKEKYPDMLCVCIPSADGGEGTLEAIMHTVKCKKVFLYANNPICETIKTYYAVTDKNEAVIEMATINGITLINPLSPLLSSTYGTGEIIKNALDKGIRKIYIGIGGSATTDGGTGCLEALGVRFFDKNKNVLHGCGDNLIKIDKIDASGLDKRLKDTHITVLCDVKNPLFGKNGAAYVFAPQKGANENEVVYLDEGLRNLSKKTKSVLKKDCSLYEGSGAAGGLGFALISYLNAEMKSGVDSVLDLCSFDEKIKGADIIITGEGKMDLQSIQGKLPFGVAKRAGNIPVTAVVGIKDIDDETAKKSGISRIIEANSEHLPFEEVKKVCREQLMKAALEIEL